MIFCVKQRNTLLHPIIFANPARMPENDKYSAHKKNKKKIINSILKIITKKNSKSSYTNLSRFDPI